ncbi:acyclic terpene utilization AtuA family protein [Amycolatopsis sp. H20-H5]|uniref:acyclic terpene utilization AtuA family protein n=1 Tax=Amycolatopsis sp. H20-H5 TaxID=3046309 RepID=UPI002DBC4D16|nr:acyclic terpene utilization AtuA family protein [Amycolatopsis sp. H20-H5]MEC3974478.1 acyclic terpene utilization AtuA family protein [Amycolatopsis sp. H20-H5]
MSAALTTILTPTGMLGYGYPVADFWSALDLGVEAIVVDAGSTDPGPYLLGLGETLCTDESVVRDLTPMLEAAGTRGIPLFVGSAGGAGTDAQVDHLVSLVDSIGRENGWRLTVATVHTALSPEVVLDRLDQGQIRHSVRDELPTRADIADAVALVAQVGAEPFTRIIESPQKADVVIAGRAYDPAPHAAWAISRGVAPALAWHAGKILECGGACAEPKGSGVLARFFDDCFTVTPMSPGARCTPLSVAAHTMYEKSRPDLLPGPDGVLDVRACRYEVVDERTVRVSGSKHHDGESPTLKVEGATVTGHRAVFMGGVRDPILIDQIDTFLDTLRKILSGLYPELASGAAQLHFHVYGRDGVMGAREPETGTPFELGILAEVTAATPAKAKAIAAHARIGMLHLPYDGQIATAGNFALPLNPMETAIGPVCRFSVYHVLDATGLPAFPVRQREVGA